MGIKFIDLIHGNTPPGMFPLRHKILGKEYKPIGVRGMFEYVKT